MKKLKFLPTVLMLVLCVGVLAIGIYAITPSKNTIDGTITINPSNTEIDVQLYHTAVADSNKIGGLETIRAGKTLDISCSALNYIMTDVNELADANKTPKVVIFAITNKSDDQALGAYFFDPATTLPTEGENAGKAQDENILKTYTFDGVEKVSKNPVPDILKATFGGYTEIPAGETKTISITFELLKLWGEDVEVSFNGLNISLNVEPIFEVVKDDAYYRELGYTIVTQANLDANTYKGNTTIQNVKIADGVTNINALAFYNCTGITNLVLPTTLKAIGSYAFDYCSSIISIEIPAGVETIGEYAFDYCDDIKAIWIPKSVTTLSSCSIAFGPDEMALSTKSWFAHIYFEGSSPAVVEDDNGCSWKTGNSDSRYVISSSFIHENASYADFLATIAEE